MRLTRAQLLPPLRAGFKTPAGAPLDHAAIAFALALWESGGELGAYGDKDRGGSLGLWQVHQPTWAKTIGDFPTTDGSQDERLAMEIAYVQPVFRDMTAGITSAIAVVAKRAKAGERFMFSPIRDLPVWASIAWQYGGGALRKWVASSLDLSARGFKKWRTDNGLSVQPDHDKRQEFISSTYLLAIEKPERLLRNLRAVSIASGVDFFSSAAKELKAKRTTIQAWARENAGKLVRGALRSSGTRNAVKMAVAAGVVYWGATEPAPGGGRQLSKEISQNATALMGGLALTVMAKAGLG